MKLFGQFGGKLVTVGILISVYGAVNAFMLTGMRTPYILAQDNLLPFSEKSVRPIFIPVCQSLVL